MNENEVLILLPARGGSTRVVGKNLRLLAGKPLVAHAITNALASKMGKVLVSTDSPEIAKAAVEAGAITPFSRPKEMSDAHSPSIWCILHALQWFQQNDWPIPTYIAFCPPTNPFVKPSSIQGMISVLRSKPDVNSIVSIAEPKTHPFKIVGRDPNGFIHPGAIEIEGKSILNVERSQDYPKVWEGSPACRITHSRYFLNLLEKNPDVFQHSGKTYDPNSCLGFEISAVEAIDVDTEIDFFVAESIAQMNKSQ